MKKLFIEARKKFDNIDFSKLDSLPGNTISLGATIQYLDLIPKLNQYLESKGKKAIIKQGAYYESHIIGCNPLAFDKKADTILLLADGKFHALNNAVNLDKEIYVFNTQKLETITNQDIQNYKQHIQAKINRFLHEERIGVIISTKPGQNYKQPDQLSKKIENLKKKPFIFEADSINIGELENFPDIKIWINTACYGLGLDDKRILNLKDVLEFL